jgi:hypothetical protein
MQRLSAPAAKKIISFSISILRRFGANLSGKDRRAAVGLLFFSGSPQG